MAIVHQEYVNYNGNCRGWIEEYRTLVKGGVSFYCGCGRKLRVDFRKEFKKTKLYEFEITHGAKTRRYHSKNPLETEIFKRMEQVTKYVDCDMFALTRGAY